LQQAAYLKPESAEIQYDLGKLYSMRDMMTAAKPEFELAIRLDPTDAEAYNALGFTEDALGDETAAFQDYQRAIRFANQKGLKLEAPYINLSAYYNRHSNPEIAIQYAQKALGVNPGSDLAYFQMAKAYRSRLQWNQVATSLRKAIALKPASAQYYYILGEAYRKLGRPQDSEVAMSTFRKLEQHSELLEQQMRDARNLSITGLESPQNR
jgi:tetratricopeptide (TPR) repeat protein